MMTMTLTITPAEIQLQLQWYAWVEFLQLLLLCHCRLTRQHSYLQSYHTPALILPYSLPPSVYSKSSSDSHSTLSNMCPIHSTTATSCCGILSQSNSEFVVSKTALYTYKYIKIGIWSRTFGYPVRVLISCVPHQVSRLTIRHSWAPSNRVRWYLP